MESNSDSILPMENVVQLKKESRLAVHERDHLLKANAEAKVTLRTRVQEVTVLEQGNAAVY